MRRRLILSTALIALVAVVVLGVPLGIVDAARLRQDSTSRLEHEADAVAGAIDDRVERHQPISPALLRPFIASAHRVTVMTPSGERITTGPPLGGETVRVHAGAPLGGSVVTEALIGETDARVHRAWLLIAALSLGGVLTAVGLAALQARRLARPLEAIARRSAQLGDGDFSIRAGHFGVPEIDAIAQGLDSSAGRIAELVAREREFSANVSHQLRTPLTALRLRLEGVGGAGGAAARAGELEAALGETDRLETTIADLLAHARQASAGTAVTVNLGAVAHEHAARWRPVFARSQRALDVAAEKNVLVRASRGTVGQVLDVLLDNALRHGAGAARITSAADGRFARLTVADAGPGVFGEERDRIFERGASRTGGSGIGLHLARTLAQADNGSLRVLDGDPTRFELRLPRLAP
ncbi:MAG: ATP-binding protein [Solirubrobacteraceae bacterium]